MLVVFPSEVQIVNGPKSYSTYWAYGSSSYTLQNNKTVEVNATNRQTTVINDSKAVIEIEELIYGNPFYQPNTFVLNEGDLIVLDAGISFFFDEKIPDQIDVEYGKYAIEYWLRESK